MTHTSFESTIVDMIAVTKNCFSHFNKAHQVLFNDSPFSEKITVQIFLAGIVT